jgi:hypothetical protein
MEVLTLLIGMDAEWIRTSEIMYLQTMSARQRRMSPRPTAQRQHAPIVATSTAPTAEE